MIQLLAAALLLIQTSFYALSFTSSEGASINMEAFKGKRVLLVNIATESPLAAQLAGLEELQQRYRDSLVVIGFPSNSFGRESRSDAQIREYSQTTYGGRFLLAQKAPVKGGDAQAVYRWLSRQSENGMMDEEVLGDFQKYLINEDGLLIGVFAPSVDPLDHCITDAVTGN